jgi:hypothetical protein
MEQADVLLLKSYEIRSRKICILKNREEKKKLVMSVALVTAKQTQR